MIIRRKRYAKDMHHKSTISFNHTIPKISTTRIDHLPLVIMTILSTRELLRVTPKTPGFGNKENIPTQKTWTNNQIGSQCTEASQKNGTFGASNDRGGW
jgi:hypothetical protein